MRKPVILCVDDEKDVLDTLFNILLDEFKSEYDIELAETGEDAIEIFEEHMLNNIDIPVVITDYIMPGMKGDELLITLHKKHPQMIKILLTGQATLEGVKNAYEYADLYRYLDKPWEKHDLILTIKEALKSYYKDRKLAKAEEKYKRIFDNAAEGIVQTTLEGEIIVINPAMVKILGYSSQEEGLSMINTSHEVYVDNADRKKLIDKILIAKSIIEYETRLRKRDGNIIWVEVNAGPVFNDNGEIEKIESFVRDITEKKRVQEELEGYQKHLEYLVKERTEKLDKALKEQEMLNLRLVRAGKQINDNINYARRIQVSILPEKKQIKKFYKDIFIIWHPRDQVGGDFYWFKETDKGCLLALADCTGHGVSGAFMTMIAYSELNRITDEFCDNDPSCILRELNIRIKRTLNKESKESYVDDGLDIAVCYFPFKTNFLLFASAKLSLFINNGVEVKRIKGDRQSIGYLSSKEDYCFINREIQYSVNDSIFLTSDGYLDQPGGEKRRSFGYKRFSDLLQEIQSKPMNEQKIILIQKLEEYRGIDYDQIDDVTIIGLML